MNEKDINLLLDFGYTMAQISQLIKLKNDGVPIEDAFNYKDAKLLMEKDADDYRDFKSIVQKASFNETQKKYFFRAFMDGINYALPVNAGMCNGASVYIVQVLYEIRKDSLDIDITPMLNKNYSQDLLQQIWRDLRNGIDVNVYLNSELSSKKKEILREALKKGVNIKDDLEEFSFLDENDISNLIILHNEKYDYKAILKKFKDTKKAVYICEAQKKYSIEPLKFLSNKMSLDVIKELCERAGKGENVNIFKNINVTSVESIPLYIKVNEYGYSAKEMKNYGTKTLQQIIKAFEEGMTREQIDVITSVDYYTTMPIISDCIKYKQEEYIEYLKTHESFFMMDYADNIKSLLKYNFENEEKYNLLELLLGEDGRPVQSNVFSFYVKLITEIGVDKKMFDLLKDNKFSLKQSRIIVSAYKEGYDISCMLDNRLSETQMQSIRNCLDLGLSITKTKDYDLPEVKSPIYDDEVKSRVRYFGKDAFYYEIEDYDGNCRMIKYYDGPGW